jgi:hypothetical protein
MVKLFLGDALDWLRVKCPQTIDACHHVAFETVIANLCFERHYFIVTLANARAAGTFEGALGPDSTPKASLVKACRNSSISAGVIGLFIFFSS